MKYCERKAQQTNTSLFEYAKQFNLDTHKKLTKEPVVRHFPRFKITSKDDAKFEEYCQVQLMIYKPSRKLEDLKDGLEQSWS